MKKLEKAVGTLIHCLSSGLQGKQVTHQTGPKKSYTNRKIKPEIPNTQDTGTLAGYHDLGYNKKKLYPLEKTTVSELSPRYIPWRNSFNTEKNK